MERNDKKDIRIRMPPQEMISQATHIGPKANHNNYS